MDNRYIIALASIFILVFGLAACGGGSDPKPVATTVPAEPTMVSIPATPVPVAEPVSQTNPTPATANAPDTNGVGDDLFELGKTIFLEDAAEGVGCQICHGPEARGNIGPNIRGKNPGDIEFALDVVDAMFFIHLNQKEIEAVSTYLKWLAEQP